MPSRHGVPGSWCIPALFLALLVATPLTLEAQAANPDVAKAKTALAKYEDPLAAVADGYFSTVACMDFPKGGESMGGMMAYKPGGMGVHFLNANLIGPTLDPAKPQVLIYEPVGDKLKLAAAEWFVPVAVSKTPPSVLGRTLEGPMEGHAPIMPAGLAHWDLHVWLWKNNPAGMFSSTNPDLKCPKTGYSYSGDAPKMIHGN